MKKGEKKSFLFSILAGAILVIGSYWIIFRGSPEFFTLISENGELQVEGISVNATELYLASNPAEESMTIHSIQPEALARQAEIRVTNNAEERELYVFDEIYESWRMHEGIWDGQGVTQFGTGEMIEVDIPNYSQLMEEERKSPPENAVGYLQFMTYQVEGELIRRLLPSTIQAEACAGVQQRTQKQEEARNQKKINTVVNGEPKEITLQVMTRWFIDEQSTCTQFSTNQ